MEFFNTLLANAVLQRAMTNSVASVMLSADRENARSTYILEVLRTDSALRGVIKNMARVSDNPGQKQLAAILMTFDALSAEKKAQFIDAYATCATIASLGSREVAYQSTWQGGSQPPHFVP